RVDAEAVDAELLPDGTPVPPVAGIARPLLPVRGVARRAEGGNFAERRLAPARAVHGAIIAEPELNAATAAAAGRSSTSPRASPRASPGASARGDFKIAGMAGGRSRAAFAALLGLAVLDAAGYGVLAPVVPSIARETGAGPAVMGALVTSFAVGQL